MHLVGRVATLETRNYVGLQTSISYIDVEAGWMA